MKCKNREELKNLTNKELELAIVEEEVRLGWKFKSYNLQLMEEEQRRRIKLNKRLHCTLNKEEKTIDIKVLERTKYWNRGLTGLNKNWSLCELVHWSFWRKNGPTIKLRVVKKNGIIKIYHGKCIYNLKKESNLEELYNNLYSHITNPCIRADYNKRYGRHIELTFYDFFLMCSKKGLSKSIKRKGDFLNARLINGGISAKDSILNIGKIIKRRKVKKKGVEDEKKRIIKKT